MDYPLTLYTPECREVSSIHSDSVASSCRLSFFFVFSSTKYSKRGSTATTIVVVVSYSTTFSFAASTVSTTSIAFAASAGVNNSASARTLADMAYTPQDVRFSTVTHPVLPIR